MRRRYGGSSLIVLGLAVAACNSPKPIPATPAATLRAERLPNSRPARADADLDADSQTSRPAVDPNDHRPLIVCFGDSLTAGLGTRAGQTYPDYLQTDLDTAHFRYRVVNQGVSGDTTKDGVARLPDVLAMHPYLVVVEFGGNDGLRGLRVEDTRANLDTILGTLQKSGAKVVLAGITLPPDYGPDYIRRFNENYTVLAAQYRVPLLPFLFKNVYGVPGMMQRDMTHATAKGNAIVAQNVLPLVTTLLKR